MAAPAIPPTIDYTQPPSATEVEIMLRAAALWPPDTEPYQQQGAQRQAAINCNSFLKEFETRTGWQPFVADTSKPHEVRYYREADTNGMLQLRAGMQTIDSIVVDGTTLVENTGWYGLPDPDSLYPTAITEVKMLQGGIFSPGYWPAYLNPRRIVVTGQFGVYTTWPEDAWQAILGMASLLTLTSTNSPQRIASWSKGGFSESYFILGQVQPQDLIREWKPGFDRACQRYQRTVC